MALGNKASGVLAEIGIEAERIRHPAQGGAREFREHVMDPKPVRGKSGTYITVSGKLRSLSAEVVSVIQSLNPRPGNSIGDDDIEYVDPDVVVRKDNGRWLVELNPKTAPRVRINSTYEQAAQTFQDILARFPGHQVTVAAETRLRRIQQTIQ